ncbi:hypothetical protein K0G90_23725 [Bacteroides thetaiotaomicron]|jgi:hypothetical protein|uniref:Uncharacterized protein n=1 Tax=Bacteroides thetaiotaomicron TaxID=818 RepID=A0AAW4ZJT6_BACT4|nr:hypothetical protein [Bacteroides thetaiotaomicron]DAQ90659.1 MAG TPA: hypothetical protein [Caudoviricetes sp.]MCE9240203.1 hypothetical protein [Bacteroides thetaiotaomicron]MCE9269470.1 hypothetical protein [Bacteroides thetaiotaomicron]MCE9279095.1 hypothetical protein [Bacteroides thetaiotaomicron]MCE9293324.1 hypothetical protein [Bacteroides thetaiotaomicron]
MISEDLVKQRFVHDTISQGINLIYETQERVVRTYLNTRSGNLLSYIQRRPFTSQVMEGKQVYYMRILSYLRYLDIHYRKGEDRISRHIRSNLALYNRTVWGVLYRETFPEIRYGYNEEIRASIRKELEQALIYEQSQNW